MSSTDARRAAVASGLSALCTAYLTGNRVAEGQWLLAAITAVTTAGLAYTAAVFSRSTGGTP